MRQGRPSKPSIRQIRPGCWQVRASTPSGRKKQTFDSLKAAEMQLACWLDTDTTLEMRATALTAPQLRDAEKAQVILEELGLGYLDAARWLRTHYRAPARVKFATAIDEFMAALKTKGTSEVRRSKLRLSLVALEKFLAREELGNVTRDEIEKFLAARAGERSARTWNHCLGDLSQFFGWHVERGIVAEDPTRGISKKAVSDSRPVILGPEEARALMEDLEKNHPEWCAFAALLLFGGIRPDGEVIRLDAELRASATADKKSPFRGDGVEVDGKAHGRRLVPYKNCGPLSEWLAAYPAAPATGLFPNPKARRKQVDEWQTIRARHKLGRDVLRHSAATAMLSAGLNLGAVALTLGNSESMLRKHYLDPLHAVGADYAAALYAILPQKG